ncbi:MAG: hypothetical protein ABIJ31_00380 [Pseudomonadota bacterium]
MEKFCHIEDLHRDMLLKMQKAGVEFTDIYRTMVPLDLTHMSDRIREKEISIQIEQFLIKLCPFLNYIRIDNQHDLAVCGAYKNRMVLGGKLLHEVCETGNHLHCEYFLNPGTIS